MQKQAFRQTLLAATIAVLGVLSAPGAALAQDASPAAMQAANAQTAKPNVVGLATGGTIAGTGASTVNSATYTASSASADKPAPKAGAATKPAKSGEAVPAARQ